MIKGAPNFGPVHSFCNVITYNCAYDARDDEVNLVNLLQCPAVNR